MPKKTLFICLILFFIGLGSLLAWDNKIIHPRLTQKAIEVYNSEKEKDITQEQAEWIVQGAIEEDTDPRYLNHFYNPKTGKGLNDGWLRGRPAPDWAFSQDSASGDYSVGVILDYYREDNPKKAYIGVGHILHLMQDMAVPAHVRNDAHPSGDPFEEWAKEYGNTLKKYIVISVKDIETSFRDLASFTYENFYSKDSISQFNSSKYDFEIKEINGKKRKFFLNNVDGVSYKLLYTKNPDSIYPVFEIGGDIYLNMDYWDQLHPKAIGYSAGVLEWFVNEFEKIDKEKAEEDRRLSEKGWFSRSWDKVAHFLGKAKDTPSNISNYVKERTLVAGSQVVHNALDGLKSGGNKTAKYVGYMQYGVGKTWDDTRQAAQDLGEKGVEQIGRVLAGFEGEEAVEPASAETDLEELSSAKELSSSRSVKMKVGYVIDGDTIIVSQDGEREKVRLIGIDAPELGEPGPRDDECLAWPARLRLMELLSGRELRLVPDPNMERDKYGRLLRYAYADDIFLNQVMVREGLAEAFFCRAGWQNCPLATDQGRKQAIQKASLEARHNLRGLYSRVCEEVPDKIAKKGLEVKGEAEDITQDNWFVGGPGKDSGPNIPQKSGQKNTSKNTDQEEASSTQEAVPAGPEASFGISGFNLSDPASDSASYTATSLVVVELHITSATSADYCLQDSSLDIADCLWFTGKPDYYRISERDGLHSATVYIRAGEKLASSTAQIYALLDKPFIHWSGVSSGWASTSDLTIELATDREWCHWSYRWLDNEWQRASSGKSLVIDTSLPDGEHALTVRATDPADNTATSARSWITDTEAPADPELWFVSATGSPGLTLEWQAASSSEDISGYQLDKRIDGQSWHKLAQISSSSYIYSAKEPAGTDIAFRVRAWDLAGNASDWSEIVSYTIPESEPIPGIVISEVGVGGPDGAYDEFVELYNPTASSVDITGWQLESSSASGASWLSRTGDGLPDGTIEPLHYYLLAPDTYTGEITPDYEHTARWGLAGSGGHVRLLDGNSREADRAGWGGAAEPEGSPAGTGQTLERKAAATSTLESMGADGEHYLAGNSYDTDNNSTDFIAKDLREPQNSESLPEPRKPEPEPGPIDGELWHHWPLGQEEGDLALDLAAGDDLPLGQAAWQQCLETDSYVLATPPDSEITKSLTLPVPADNMYVSFWHRWTNSAEGQTSIYFKDAQGEVVFGMEFEMTGTRVIVNGVEHAIPIRMAYSNSYSYDSYLWEQFGFKSNAALDEAVFYNAGYETPLEVPLATSLITEIVIENAAESNVLWSDILIRTGDITNAKIIEMTEDDWCKYSADCKSQDPVLI